MRYDPATIEKKWLAKGSRRPYLVRVDWDVSSAAGERKAPHVGPSNGLTCRYRSLISEG